ncbi:hypothetical protein VNI00_000990 [Paramarasmius palmivorus]|uniref:Uncharacterized protein n=1 Tax=Paramarasmius palmivorus TaxID=297713 RepID=A0AAW0EAP6_9AGAR
MHPASLANRQILYLDPSTGSSHSDTYPGNLLHNHSIVHYKTVSTVTTNPHTSATREDRPHHRDLTNRVKPRESTLVVRTREQIETDIYSTQPYPSSKSRRHRRTYQSHTRQIEVASRPQRPKRRGSEVDIDIIAEGDAIIFAEQFARRRYREPGLARRSKVENRAMSKWLGIYLARHLSEDTDFTHYIRDAIALDIHNVLDKHQPENAVIFLALKTSAMRLGTAIINEIEIHALSLLDWNLSITPPEWTRWLITLQQSIDLKSGSSVNWSVNTAVFRMLGESLKEMLDVYSADPFAPLPSTPSNTFPSKHNRKSLQAFWGLLVTGLRLPPIDSGAALALDPDVTVGEAWIPREDFDAIDDEYVKNRDEERQKGGDPDRRTAILQWRELVRNEPV